MEFTKLLDCVSNIIEKNANKNFQFVMLRYLLITGSASKKDIAIELQNYNQDVKKDYRSAGDVFKVLTEPQKDLVTEDHQMFSINNFDELSDEQRYSLINKCNEKILMIKKIKNSGSTPTNLDMTWKNAAFKVLKEENKPLHRVKITDLILKRHYVKEHNALTPYETVARDIDKDIESSNESLFKKIEPGIYGLNDSKFELDENNDLLLMGHKLFLMEIKQRKSKEEFRDFNHTDFVEDEVKYKISSLENSLKLLSINEWDGWKSSPEKICLSVRNAVAQKISSSLIWSPPYKTEISYFDELDDALKKDLGLQLYEFFKGKNPIEQRFDHFILFLKKIDRVPEIRLLAYLMFLYNPEKYFPIHPSKFNKLLEFHNIPKIDDVSWGKYSQYVELASKIKSFLVKLNLGNNLSAIQVQSYMWIIAGEVSKKFWMIRAGKDGQDWDNQKNAGIIGIHYETIDLSKFRRTKNGSNELARLELGTEISKIRRTRGEDIKKKKIDSVVGQFRKFFSINRNKYGTKIIAIGDNSTVLGIGNATGEYEFRTDISKCCHTIPVEWNDTKNRQISTITNFNLSVKEIDVKEYLKIINEDLTNESKQTEYFLLRYNGKDSIPKTQEQWRDMLGEQYHFGQGVANQKAIREAGIGTKTIWYKTKNLPGFYFWGYGSVQEIRTNQEDGDWNLLYSDFKYFEQGNDSIEEQEVFLHRPNESIEEQIKDLPGYNQNNSIIKITKKIYEEITGDITSMSSPKIPIETNNKFFNILNKKKQFFFYGPPGTGKTFTAKKIAREFIKESQTKFFSDEQYHEYVLSMINKVSHEKGFELKKQTNNQIILKNSQKEIRIYLNYSKSGKQTPHDCYVGISQSVIDFLNQTDDENRFVLILNNDVKNFVSLPHPFIIKNVKLSGGENWNSDGDGDHSFHVHVYDDSSQFRSNDSYSENYVDCSDFLSNIEILFNSHGKSCNKLEKVTFHQSFSYEEFIEGIRPKTDDKINQVTYPIEDGIFKRLSKCASLHDKENFVLIIDEINRGNISKIFGELITLLENDKRGDEVTLPYSKKLFSVPKNLYIIGTMNTADRSLVHIDAALKRRFGQYELMPDYSLLDSKIDKIHLGTLLENINQKIIKAGFRDNQIGHSYFMTDENPITTREELQFAFAYDIVPLLKDNFYDDDKILRDILGDEFIDENRDTISEWMEDVSKFMTSLESAYPEAIE